MKNSYKIIDSHCHIYPDKLAEKAAKGISEFYYGMPMDGDGSVGRLLNVGTAAGVDKFVVCSVATAPGQVTGINNFIAEAVRASQGAFIGLGTLHPDGADPEGDIRRIKALGLKGVKLHADIQRIAIDDPRCFKLYELLQGDLPVLLHTGDGRYGYSNPGNLIPVLDTFKKLTVIGAHYGGWSVWEEAAHRLSRYENLYVDTSSTFGCKGLEFIKNLLPKYDAGRVLFGSDYPMWNPVSELNALFALNLPDAVYRKILSENCARVYSL